jgi:hypothetical protein
MKFVCISFEDGQYYLVSTKSGEVKNPKVAISEETAKELLDAGIVTCS